MEGSLSEHAARRKGYALIVNQGTAGSRAITEWGRRSWAATAAGIAALAFLSASPAAVRAETPPDLQGSAPVEAAATPSVTVYLLLGDGDPAIVSTHASTVGELLLASHVRVAQNDFVSAPADTPLVDGMKVEYRQAKLVDVFVGKRKYTVHSAAATIAELLAAQHVAIGPNDEVTPPLYVPPVPHDVVRVTRVRVWTSHERHAIAPGLRERSDANLAFGTTRTLDPGSPGLRETTVRFERRDDARPTRTVLASRIIRTPRPRLIARGVAEYASLAHVAEQGFNSALHFAGSALHMIATAYTAGCYGCSGITATGKHAGFGVIAVDPSIIPLGTQLFIPGYGRAIAGDTGGAIVGHRVDLGMNTLAQALRFGRRSVTVYVLR
jgi:3D (Asp-Asp-Asp) domain-containing protein